MKHYYVVLKLRGGGFASVPDISAADEFGAIKSTMQKLGLGLDDVDSATAVEL